MAKEFDINEYIASLNLSEEDKKAVAPIFAKPEVVAEVKRGWNSKAEGSELMNQVSEAKRQAAAEKAEADRIKAEATAEIQKNRDWAEALKKYEPSFIQNKAQLDALTEEKAAYEAYLESIGVEPAFALSGKQPLKPAPVVKEPPVSEPKQPAELDPKIMEKFVSREAAQQAIGLAVNLPFELTTLNFKHMELYGKPLPGAELQALQQEYLNSENTRSLSTIAAEKFHFAEREKELQEQSINERVQKQAEEMFTKRMSELNLPGAALDSLTPASAESAVHFASKGFSENAKRPGDGDATQVSAEEMQLFIQANQELDARGIRPTPY